MFKFLTVVCIFLVVVGLLFFGSRGCESVFPQERVCAEQEDENFDTGLLAFRQGNYPLAIYHFNQYLSLCPDASPEQRRRTFELISSSRKKFLQEMLPWRSAEPESPRISVELEEKYREVMRQNETLKLEVARLKERLAGASAAAAETQGPAVGVLAPSAETPASVPAPPPPPEKPTVPATHTVVAGDTLSGISKKYYGTPARWREIYEANRVSMSSPSALKIGMVLKLPRP